MADYAFAFAIIMLIVTSAALAYIGYVLAFLASAFIKRKERIEWGKKFNAALIEGLKIGSINTLNDVINIYKGVAGLRSEDYRYRWGLSRLLRSLLVDLNTKKEDVIDKSVEDQVIKDWHQKITGFITENEAKSPYADLPDAERNILSDISHFLDLKDPDSVRRKIFELAGVIRVRNDDFEKIKRLNRWSVPLAIIGFVLTTIFGILAWM